MAIAEDVQRHAGAAFDAIRSEFAIKMTDARWCAPKHELAAILRALQDACSTALAVAARNTALEIQGRQRAAVAAHAGRHQRPPTARPGTDAGTPSPE
jgi:hypothetical protein